MAVNKVVYGGNTLVDLTGDTVTAADLADGVKATGADGNPIVGIMQKVTIDAELSTTSTNPVQNKVIKEALDGKLGKNDTAVNASKVNNLTVETAVPKNAKFTDTVYTHPSTHPAGMITGLANVATSGSYNDLSDKPTIPSAYTHPTTSGNKHIPSGGSSGQILRWSADGTAVWGADKNTVPSRYITTKYFNGTDWYEVYNDGWVRQGGLATKQNTTYTFLKPFANTNFSFTTGLHNFFNNHNQGVTIKSMSATSFQLNMWYGEAGSGDGNTRWVAEGYKARY